MSATEGTVRFGDQVGSIDELSAIHGEPSQIARDKIIDHVDGHCRAFIERSPFFLLSTAGPDGRCDVSPRGGPPGFVEILDEGRLVFADAQGNRLADSLRNIVQTGRAGLLFLIPGLDETLRVNGRACVTRDPEILARHEIQKGRPPELAIGLEVEEAFLHCAKAFIRSDLWSPDSWQSLEGLARPAQIWKDHAALPTPVEEIEEMLVVEYSEELY